MSKYSSNSVTNPTLTNDMTLRCVSHVPGCCCRCLQADDQRFLSGSDDKTIKVWNIETGERLVTLRSTGYGITCLQFSDTRIVSGSYDNKVLLWDFTV